MSPVRILPFALLLAAAAPVNPPPIVPYEVPAEPGLAAEPWASGLDHPWAIGWLPDGRALVSERPGRLRLIARDGSVGPAIAGVPKVLALGQGGLLDLALHPDFARNQLVYFSYLAGSADANRLVLGRARLAEDRLADVRELRHNPVAKPGGQNLGGRLLWLPDGTLLMSVGDGGNAVRLDGALIREKSQDPRSWFGKLLRLTAEGRAAAGNPGQAAERGQWSDVLWTLGNRNIQGLARDSETGAIWATEHGARGGDELNRIRAGGNYGWPAVTYSREYSGGEITSLRHRPDVTPPVSVWTPSIAPSGLAVYRARAIPALAGAILAGGLQSADVRVIRLAADGRPASERRVRIGARVRDVRVGPDGLVYVLTDAADGRILRLRPSAAPAGR